MYTHARTHTERRRLSDIHQNTAIYLAVFVLKQELRAPKRPFFCWQPTDMIQLDMKTSGDAGTRTFTKSWPCTPPSMSLLSGFRNLQSCTDEVFRPLTTNIPFLGYRAVVKEMPPISSAWYAICVSVRQKDVRLPILYTYYGRTPDPGTGRLDKYEIPTEI